VVIKRLGDIPKSPLPLGWSEEFQQVQCFYERLDRVAGSFLIGHYGALLDFDSHYEDNYRIMQQDVMSVKKINHRESNTRVGKSDKEFCHRWIFGGSAASPDEAGVEEDEVT